MYINKAKVKQFFHEHNKRISPQAISELDRKIENILWDAMRLTRNFKTITDTEIRFASGKGA